MEGVEPHSWSFSIGKKLRGGTRLGVLSEEEIRYGGLKAYSKTETIDRFRRLYDIVGLDSNGTDVVLRIAKRFMTSILVGATMYVSICLSPWATVIRNIQRLWVGKRLGGRWRAV